VKDRTALDEGLHICCDQGERSGIAELLECIAALTASESQLEQPVFLGGGIPTLVTLLDFGQRTGPGGWRVFRLSEKSVKLGVC
jgi:hypothetical protein